MKIARCEPVTRARTGLAFSETVADLAVEYAKYFVEDRGDSCAISSLSNGAFF